MEEEISFTPEMNNLLHDCTKLSGNYRHEFTMPEHFLAILLNDVPFIESLNAIGANPDRLRDKINNYLKSVESIPEGVDYVLSLSMQMRQMLFSAETARAAADKDCVSVSLMVRGLLALHESFAQHFLEEAIRGKEGDFFKELAWHYDLTDDFDLMDDFDRDDIFESDLNKFRQQWRNLVTCVNDCIENRNPLIGREPELERTIRVLCRKEKNNPLHVGEPGVGKTALVYGLARKINNGDVPERLKNSRIFQLDLGTLIAGTQFRGDFEKRLKAVMEGILAEEQNPIVYIDEIHNLVGAGAVGESSLDASNMLKPYLEGGEIRFIGSTTYDEYNRHFSRSKGIVRRFQQIDIKEPSVEETIEILRQLKSNYENFHGVSYTDKALEFAVTGSVRHISDRFLPDKALDLIDEAGAYRELHPLTQKKQTVDHNLVAEILSKVCRIDSKALQASDNASLKTLSTRISSQIYGQDEAVGMVAESVLFAKAGLTEEGKPMASLLFVGPTGVGKTEVAKVLAKELGMSLVRFDMSEYTEKHTVAKLIGSPAGYVGYEDGGLLTDAIRKSPNCVLLLDEIEKAHPDIYNILLQVMDYARLTDNKGRHADFKNVILIMTSNAGAQHASKAKLGFASTATAGSAMLAHVKKIFKPEFLNRLTGTVVFNDMDRDMASLILDKKLRQLECRLEERKVKFSLSPEARRHILSLGFSVEYGARELDRVISSNLKPLLTSEILFGFLKKGGRAKIELENGKLTIRNQKNGLPSE